MKQSTSDFPTLSNSDTDKMVSYVISRANLASIGPIFIAYDPSQTRATKTRDSSGLKLYHAQERVNNVTKAVEALESVIQPDKRWEAGMPEWERAKQMVHRRNFQRALDNLERLVVQRMFELTRINLSHTGISFPQPFIYICS